MTASLLPEPYDRSKSAGPIPARVEDASATVARSSPPGAAEKSLLDTGHGDALMRRVAWGADHVRPMRTAFLRYGRHHCGGPGRHWQ